MSDGILLYSPENCVQYLGLEHGKLKKKKKRKKGMCVCGQMGHFDVLQKLKEHCKSTYILIKTFLIRKNIKVES